MESFRKWALTAAISSVAITGCSGSSSSSGSSRITPESPESPATSTETGVFIDSAVAGINYTTSPSGQQGQTNSLGEYQYEQGDKVTFSIGGISLPAVTATERVTPADMGNGTTDWSSDETVINILRLLQTLDEDGNPDNGITITKDTHTALRDVAIDPTLSAADFETQASTAIASTGKTLIDTPDALNHFAASQNIDVQGSWVYEEKGGSIHVLTFLNDSKYLVVHSKPESKQQPAGGGEYGTYTWDSITGELNLSVINDSDGSGGLAGNNETATWNMKLVNGGLHLHSDQENEDVIFNPVRNERNSLVGSWYIGENNRTAHNILTILDDSNYVIAHSTNTETYGSNPVAVSSEWGSYSFNGDHFTVTDVDVDLDGPGGLYDSPVHDGDGPVDGPAILHPTGELTITDNADDENTFTFRRIGRYSVKLRDFEGDTQLVYVNAQESWDEDEDSIHFVFPDLIEPGSPNRYDLTFSSDQVITVDMGTENEERSGVMSFEGSGEDNVAGTWNINTAGTLVFTETDGTSGDYGHWRFLALNSSEILIHLDGVGSLELMFIATIPLSEKT